MCRFIVLMLVATFVLATIELETADAHAPWKHKEKLNAPLLHYGQWLRNQTQSTLKSKCRRSYEIQYSPYYTIPINLRLWALNLWKTRLQAVLELKSNCWAINAPPHFNAWLCIFKYETGFTYNWHISTGNGYYGGLQMDWSFMRTYGPKLLRTKGTANNWTALEQMWVAERAFRTRGFNPWPNTARACHLI